jgi:hypothetical protein
MGKKSDSPSNQDQNNAPIYNILRNRYQGLHLRDLRIHPKNKSEQRSSVRQTQISEPSLGGNSVVIHIYFLHYIFTSAYLLSKLALENKIKILITALYRILSLMEIIFMERKKTP